MCGLLLFFALECHAAGVHTLFQHFLVGREYGNVHLGILVSCGGRLLVFGQSALDGFKVFKLQFGVDNFLIAYGIYASVYVCDVFVVETTQYMYHGICLADVAKKLIAQSFAFGCALNKACNVYDFACSGHNSTRVYNLGEAR